MVADLRVYLRDAATLPWVWGVSDCTMWVADWVRLRWGHDPAAGFRGTYASEAEMRAIIEGGLTNLIRPVIGLPERLDAPCDGDVGIIDLRGAEVAAIRSGRFWAFRQPQGICMTRAAAHACWG